MHDSPSASCRSQLATAKARSAGWKQNERQVDAATLLAVFVPALEIEDQPEIVQRLLAFAAAARTLKAENRIEADVATHGAPVVHRPVATPATNVPPRLTSFIGREEAMEALYQLIPATRLVTLTGVGGVGKTSLAQAASSSLGLHFADGVWWVELAPLAAVQSCAPSHQYRFQVAGAARSHISRSPDNLLPR